MSVLSLIPEDKKKDLRKESLESVYSSNSRLNLLNKRKRASPLADMSGGVKGDRFVAQRVLSAKAHRVKQLQNQLADAHYHLQELSNENRVLRAMQKKQEIALQRYENSNAELPTVLNSHNEEIRIQQTKYKQLKVQFKEVSQKLKERDMQYQQLKDEHTHLLELSRDRNLLEREKLQQQVTELTAKVQAQNESIAMLQRRIVLEAKNFKHQLQNEINKHKDTRHDLDLAISNADKLSTIIEMKEKLLSTAACRNLKSPTKPTSTVNVARPVSKSKSGNDIVSSRGNDERSERSAFSNMEQLSRLCENSRNITSALSHDEDTSSSIEPRSRYVRSRNSTNSTRSTPNPRKNSKGSDEMIELAKTVQDGMADLTIFDEIDKNPSPDEMQKKIEIMKQDLMNKIKNDEAPSRKSSFIRRQSTEESVEEQIVEEKEDISDKMVPIERPKSRGRRGSSVSFYENTVIEETTTTVAINDYTGDEIEKVEKVTKIEKVPSARTRENSANDSSARKLCGKPLEKYCKDIIQDIEKSSRVIDKHMRQFNHSKFESDKLVESLQVVDKINEFVNSNGEIPETTLQELNNNFKMLTDNVFTEPTVTRKRSISGRRNSREPKNMLDDSAMSNQDLLDDLLGRK